MKYTIKKSSELCLHTKAPTITFSQNVPTSFIRTVLRYMARQDIRVIDHQGNELKVVSG